jgi:hypothetical protein
MKPQKRLLAFYFGSLSEEERLKVERDLLTDVEVLTDYLDLKRDLEAAPLPSKQPSSALWERLKPKTVQRRRLYLSLSIGAAVAAGFALILFLQPQPQPQPKPKPTELMQPSAAKVLFDSSAELPASSGVL